MKTESGLHPLTEMLAVVAVLLLMGDMLWRCIA